MRLGNIELEFRPDRSALLEGTENPEVRVWFSARPATVQSRPGAITRQPATVVVLLDCSGTMRGFGLAVEEAERWAQVARERSELRVVESDRRTVHQVTGQTLQEIKTTVRCPLAIAAQALEQVAAELHENDVFCLVGFATKASVIYDGRRRLSRQSLQNTLRKIQENPSSPGLGDGTRMREATALAASLLKADPSGKRARRLIIITDGIVEDDTETLRELEEIHNEKIAVTTIGTGQEFNEEFLTRIADWTGGTYHYAPTPADIEKRMREDLGIFQIIAAYGLSVSTRGLSGAVVTSVTQLTPQTRLFEEIRLRDDWYLVDVGDIYGTSGISLLGEFSLPALPVGKHQVGEIQLELRDPDSGLPVKGGYKIEVECFPAGSPPPSVDPEVDEMFMRLQVYRAERSAQWAQESGRMGVATVRLREASTILRHLGEKDLAEQFDQQAIDVERDQQNSDRTKTLKDWVRRLARRREEELE